MKTERRHDLETNWLAARLARWVEAIKPYMGHLFAGALVLVAVSAISSIWGKHSSARQQAAWDAYTLASYRPDRDFKSIQQVAENEEYVGTPTSDWAYLVWADRQLLLASQSYHVDHQATKDRLRRIEGIYDKLSTSAKYRPLRDRARFGLARVYELQNKIDQARQMYAQVHGPLEPLAAGRLEQLESPEVQEVYDWLASAEFSKPDPPRNPSARPSFEAELPGATANEDEDSAAPLGEDEKLEKTIEEKLANESVDDRSTESPDIASETVESVDDTNESSSTQP